MTTKDSYMSHTINRMFGGDALHDMDTRTGAALAEKGFGALTEIVVAATMEKKLDAEMPRHIIFGARNPKTAFQAIGMEPRVGAMLPCNVILHVVKGGAEVSAVDPVPLCRQSTIPRCSLSQGKCATL